jgi:hypothetical protein
MKRAFWWSLVAWFIFAGLQVYGILRQGLGWAFVRYEAPSWLGVWPGFFLTILVFTGWKSIYKGSYLAGEAAAVRTVSRLKGEEPPGAPCPGCGVLALDTAEVCPACGWVLRDIQVVHPIESLQGAESSVPSVLYVLAVVGSFLVGALATGALSEDQFQNDLLLIGTFLAGCAVSLIAAFAAIARYARSQSSRRGAA